MADAPNDLATVPQTTPDKNYFNVSVKGLKLSKTYAIQFQWIYTDETKSDWSASYVFTTSNELAPGVPAGSVPSTATGSIPVTLSSFPVKAKRVDVYVIGGIFGLGKIAYSFSTAGTATIAAPAGSYTVEMRAVTAAGITSTVGETFTITIADVGETIQAPTNPNGFSIDRALSGIQVNWAGTYANGTFTGFEAIKIYVGNSATFTNGTYREAGVMTGNNVKNTITIPVDGTYLRYDLPVYIHAAGVNKSGTLGTVQVNVANNSLGARSAIGSDLADLIITNGKLVDDAVSAAKIATAAITTTKIADDAITTPKLVANAITADKIVSSAITADKIATNAITAGKILAGTIDVTKLAAGTISTNNLEAGVITSTSYIRAGIKNVAAGTGARVEMSSSAIEDGVVDIAAGFYIYNSAGAAILSAPLTGGLSIVGNGTFTGSITGASGQFDGDLGASGGNFRVRSGDITALSGSIGGWVINSQALKTSAVTYPNIMLDPSGAKIELRSTSGNGVSEPISNYIKMDTSSGLRIGTIGATYPNFTVDMTGKMVARDSTIYGKIIAASNGVYGGTLTIDGGFIKHDQGVYIESEYGLTIYTQKTSGGALGTSGYFYVANTGDAWVGSGGTYAKSINGVFNSLNFTINNTDPGDGYRAKGYNLLNLDAAEFRQSNINNQYTASKTVVVDYYGHLSNGRALFYGPMGTSSTINNDLGSSAAIGDLYFSTS
jgi:hypothetical protein